MRRRVGKSALTALALVLVMGQWTEPVCAGEANTEVVPPILNVSVPEELKDKPFEQYVDVLLVGQAYNQVDAPLMLDAALQLAEGEQKLLRPHKAISADQALGLAVQLSVETGNAVTLARLEKAAGKLGKEDLATEVAAAAKLVGASRSEASESIALKSVRDLICKAKLMADEEELQAIIDRLANPEELERIIRLDDKFSAEQATALQEEAQAAISAIDGKPHSNPIAKETLAKLMSASRPSNSLTKPWGIYVFWGASTLSSPQGHTTAKQMVSQLGGQWRLPNANDLRALVWPMDHNQLGLPSGIFDYYWLDTYKVMCPAGNGFKTVFDVAGIWNNFIIAVAP